MLGVFLGQGGIKPNSVVTFVCRKFHPEFGRQGFFFSCFVKPMTTDWIYFLVLRAYGMAILHCFTRCCLCHYNSSKPIFPRSFPLDVILFVGLFLSIGVEAHHHAAHCCRMASTITRSTQNAGECERSTTRLSFSEKHP